MYSGADPHEIEAAGLPALAHVFAELEEGAARRLELRAQRLRTDAASRCATAQQQLEDTQKNLFRAKEHVALFRQIAELDLLAKLDEDKQKLVQRGQAILGVELAPTWVTAPLTDDDLEFAVTCARTRLEAAEAEAAQAQAQFGEFLSEWPPDEVDAGAAVSVHEAVAAEVLSQIGGMQGRLRTGLSGARCACAARTGRVSEEGERSARLTAETEFVKEASKRALMLAKCKERAARFRQLVGSESAPAGTAAHRLACATLAESCGPAYRVEDFFAFPGVWKLAWVRELLAADLKRCDGVLVSVTSPEVPGLPCEGQHRCTAALSTDGTLCVAAQATPQAPEVLRLFNFASRQSAALEVPGLEWACAWGGELFLGMRGAAEVRYASLVAAFGGLPLDAFLRFPVPEPMFAGALDRAGDGWAVFACAFQDRLVRVDFGQRRGTLVPCDREFDAVGPLSGIRVAHALCAGRARGGDVETFVIFDDGDARHAMRGLEGYPQVLPSHTAPADFARAAGVDLWGTLVYGDRVVTRAWPVRPHHRSLVRVFRDVFLCFDAHAHTWRALRIAVP